MSQDLIIAYTYTTPRDSQVHRKVYNTLTVQLREKCNNLAIQYNVVQLFVKAMETMKGNKLPYI